MTSLELGLNRVTASEIGMTIWEGRRTPGRAGGAGDGGGRPGGGICAVEDEDDDGTSSSADGCEPDSVGGADAASPSPFSPLSSSLSSSFTESSALEGGCARESAVVGSGS